MRQEEVIQIAEKFVDDEPLDPCRLVEVRRIARCELKHPTTIGDTWVVQFQFIEDEDYSASYVSVVIDDATGEPQLRETL